MDTNLVDAIHDLDQAAHRAAAEEQAAKAVKGATSGLVIGRVGGDGNNHPKAVFFATLVMRLDFQVNWDIDTARTDSRVLEYNPDFVCSLSRAKLIGALCHEVVHCINRHCTRRGVRDLADWNRAADLSVNSLIVDAGFELPDGALFPGKGEYKKLPVGLSAEEYYRLIHQEPEPEQEQQDDDSQDDQQAAQQPAGDSDDDSDEDSDDGDQESDSDESGDSNEDADDESDGTGGEGDGEPEESPDPGKCGGVKDRKSATGQPITQAEADHAETEWNVAVAQAQQIAEKRGDLPGGIARLVGKLLKPALDWKQVLREFITRRAKSRNDWKRPNRRFINHGLYLPRLGNLELGHVLCMVDTSGSIGPATLDRFGSELRDIAEVGAEKVTILYHDVEVAHVQTWTPESGDPLILEPHGGGGTSHVPAFAWVDKQDDEPPSVVVCLTDLESCFPAQPQDYPVLWVSTLEHKPHPWGERVDIPAV